MTCSLYTRGGCKEIIKRLAKTGLVNLIMIMLGGNDKVCTKANNGTAITHLPSNFSTTYVNMLELESIFLTFKKYKGSYKKINA